MRREQKVTTWLMTGLKTHGYFYKIPDSPFQQRFNIPRPFDVFGVYRGIPIAIEVKSAEEIKGLGAGAFRDHQPEALRAFSEAGGRSLVAYICYKPRSHNRCYWFDFERSPVGRKTILKKTLLEMPYDVYSNGSYSTTQFLEVIK